MLSKILNSTLLAKINSKEIKILVVFGLLYRIIFSVFYFHITIYPDSEGYLFLSQKILNFNLSHYNGERSLGYPLLISFAFGSTIITLLYQFILGIITSIYWYKTLINLRFSSKKALCVTLFLQSFINVYFYETAILVESLSLFFISVIVFMLTDNYFENRSLKNDFLIGFIIAYLVAIKPFYIYVPFVIYLFVILKNHNLKRLIFNKIVILILPLIMFFGWSYVNKINTGHFVSTTFFGLNLSQNCVYFAEKAPKEFDWIAKPYVKYREMAIKQDKDVAMSIWFARKHGAFASYNLKLCDLSSELGDFAKETIRNNPIDYLKQVFTRSWFDFWKPSIYWNFDKFNFEYAKKIVLLIWYIQVPITVFFKFTFVLLIPILSYFAFKRREISIEFIVSIIVFSGSILQGLATYGTNNRFSFPFEFIMILVVISFFKREIYFSKHLNTFRQFLNNYALFR